MVLVGGEGVPSPSPTPGDIPTVRCMGWCGGRAESGPASRAGFSCACALAGDIATTAPAHGGGGGAPKARAGWGR